MSEAFLVPGLDEDAAAPAPTITSFTPSYGAVGSFVVVTGTNFTGATAVTVNGVSASFVVDSSTQITVTVPSSATVTSGSIAATTSGGTATSGSSFVNLSTQLKVLYQGGVGTYQDEPPTVPAVANADPIAHWSDLSGNAISAVQSSDSTARPTLRKSVINGLDTTRADAVNDYLSLGAVSGYFNNSNGKEWTVLALVKLEATFTDSLEIIHGRDIAGQRYTNLGYSNQSGNPHITGPVGAGTIILSASTPYVFSWRNTHIGNACNQYVNSTLDGSSTETLQTGDSTAPLYLFGRAFVGNLNPAGCDLALLMGMSAYVTDAELTILQNLLRTLGGI